MDHSFELLFYLFSCFLITKGVTKGTSVVESIVELKCQYRATSSLQLLWLKAPSITFSSNDLIFLNSYPDIKRRVNITGNHIIGEYHLRISDVKKTDAGTYTCAVGSDNEVHQLTVIEGPLKSVSIAGKTQDNTLVGTEAQNLTISCTAVGGDPAPDMVLQIRNQNYTNSSARTIQHAIQNVGRSYDGDAVTCVAGYKSISYFPVNDTATVYLYLKPSIQSLSPNPVVTVETMPLSVTCTSTGGRPKPAVKWTIDKADITTHSTEVSSTHDTVTDTHTVTSTLTYSIDRNYNRKTLSCGFKNEATGNSYVSMSKNLDVKFSPSVSVDNETFIPSDISKQISCAALGNPANYTYFNWQHRSKYDKLIRILDKNSTLTLPPVSEEKKYQDTGKYICTASNGIEDKNGNTKQKGFGFVTSRAPPVFLSGLNQTNFGQLRGDVQIQVNVYSEPTYSSFKWLKGSREILSSSKYTMTNISDVVTDTFHGTKVQVDGYKLTLTIHDLEVEDFVIYALNLSNGVGQTVKHLVILKAESPPATPLNFSKTEATESSITLQWLPGFDGGHDQTFIVEYRTSGSLSWNTVTVPQNLETSKVDLRTYILSGLEHGTTYEIRMYAYNKYNNSEATHIVKISTKEGSGQGAIIGAVVGTLVVLIIVLVIVAIVLLRKRRDGNGPMIIPRSESVFDGEVVNNSSTAEEYANQSDYGNLNNPTGGHMNADGLQYADITFINPPKTKPGKPGKCVIHGLDDRTIYSDVDHTKKAPPLPQEGAYELTDISKGKQS